MSWLDRLFGKKEETPRVRLEEFPEWLDSKAKKLSDEIEKHASSVFSDIRRALEEIKESTALLEEAEPEGRFHLRMVKVATTNRDNMSRQVRMLLENISIPEEAGLKAVTAFHEGAVQTLNVCLENMMKSYQYTKQVFLEESKTVIADVNMLGRLLNRLIEPINSKKDVLDALENASGLVQDIKTAASDIKMREGAVKESGEKIALLEKEIEEKQKTLSLLRESEPYKDYLKSKNELVLLESNAERTESEIKGIISPLNKALNRLKQLSDSGRYTLNPESRDSLNMCLNDPVDVEPDFFLEFGKIVGSGILNLSAEKTDKIMGQIRLAASSLAPYKKEYHALVRDIERKKQEISTLGVIQEEEDMARDIASLKERLASSEKELDASKNILASLKHGIELKKQELQKNVKVIDSTVELS